MNKKLSVGFFLGLALMLASICQSAATTTIKDTESASHGDEAASYQIVDTYKYTGYRLVQFNLGVLSHYSYMLISNGQALVVDPGRDVFPQHLPGLVEPDWLPRHLGQPWLKIIDLRSQPEYNSGHIPGSLRLDVESLRGLVNGVPSMLLPANLLAGQFSLLGISPTDTVVFVTGERFHDGTLVGMACERLGHRRYAVLQGGMGRWLAEKRPVDLSLPAVTPSRYPEGPQDNFTVDYQRVLQATQDKKTVILDVRPADYYTGKKTDEARAGHIPGAINRPYTADVVTADREVRLKPVNELAEAYKKIIPSPATPVIVHCRTGHQASQTFFVLKRLLNYPNVYYYDAGWTEWATRQELPVVSLK